MTESAFVAWDAVHNAAGNPEIHVPARLGKKRAGRELDGRTWDKFPEVS